jgi:hypothetical protein
MSDTVSIGGGPNQISETIYGLFDDAMDYIEFALGDRYDAWRALTSDNQKRSLVVARRYIDRLTWITDADTFAKRDAIEAFVTASYELAALAAEDSSALVTTEQGSNVQSMSAGSASIAFFAPTTGQEMPEIIEQLLGDYLANGGDGFGAPIGNGGDCWDTWDGKRSGPF